jgi:hypothetical protein
LHSTVIDNSASAGATFADIESKLVSELDADWVFWADQTLAAIAAIA